MAWTSLLSAGIGATAQTGNSLIGAIQSKDAAEWNSRNAEKFMNIQYGMQRQLDAYGQQLQYDMWQKTNYPAQVEMLKKAGLNPALLYGKGGGGGATTGSQGGGSAPSQQAPQMHVPYMDIMAGAAQAAQIALLEAQAKKTTAEANVISSTGVKEAETRIGKMIAETSDTYTKQKLTEIQSDIARIDQANRQYVIDAEIGNINASTSKLIAEGKLTSDNAQNIINETAAKVIGQTLENELIQSKTKLTDTERQGIITGITQKWTQLKLEQTGLDIKDKERQINEFKANLEAEYPTIGHVTGNILNKAFKSLENLTEGVISNTPKKVEYK